MKSLNRWEGKSLMVSGLSLTATSLALGQVWRGERRSWVQVWSFAGGSAHHRGRPGVQGSWRPGVQGRWRPGVQGRLRPGVQGMWRPGVQGRLG